MGSHGYRPFLALIDAVDNVPQNFDFNQLYRLLLPADPRPHGFIIPATVSRLPWTDNFTVDHASRTVQLRPSPDTASDPSAWANAALQAVVDAIVAKSAHDPSTFPSVRGYHSEPFRVIGANYPLSIERFPAPLFGIGSRGAHMTAFVRDPAIPASNDPRNLKIWVARRSPHIFTYPGLLDTTVAGGVKASDEPSDCILAEAHEEASLPPDHVREHARAVGAVTYVQMNDAKGAFYPTVLYVYDIELPGNIVPTPMDDEVSEFLLMTVDEVTEAMLRREFKPNCVLVMLDFFIRHGILTQENSPEYLDLVTRLRRRLPVATAPEP
ncbi:nudix hydrolase [Sodiomyces alkalinus F11]|uniref:Nudix hydrolase n=1 Tax=Sodiomyces alkalinus (strain CBS 110278 / VKM F-3762 / F11) TaxID=1314773 RepID=A0A3N2PWY1_SODAK|nr:nudix hydrolase [Sodiomyces alkalinus F11]ROT39033.1 nudix hydrolase [Sodiomyces alkalinus F11]